MPTYKNPPYSVEVADDGKILVKDGDTLSKYSWAIYGNYDTLDVFRRPNGPGAPKPIENKNLIRTGETLIHLPHYPGPNRPPGKTPGHYPGPLPPPAARKKVDLNAPGNFEVPLTSELSYKFTVPPGEPAVKGLFLLQGEFSVDVRLTPKDGWPARVSVSKSEVKAAIEGDFTERLEASFGVALGKDQGKRIFEAARSGMLDNYRSALGGLLEATLQYDLIRWGKLTGSAEASLNLDIFKTPVHLGFSATVDDDWFLAGSMHHVRITYKAMVKCGLSPKGWYHLVYTIGKSAAMQFAKQLGQRVVQWLIAEGVFTAGGAVLSGIVASLGLAALVAWAYDRALHGNEIEALATWYESGYIRAVFEDWYNPQLPSNGALQQKLAYMGAKDAVVDARATLKEYGTADVDQMSDRQALLSFRMLVIEACNGNTAGARLALRGAIKDRARQILQSK
ncbi:MAG: hypothetical protein JNL98_14395 [Bryobacterales bacterium]|nr:hypothetical protein [Bryobacterales bacterium]